MNNKEITDLANIGVASIQRCYDQEVELRRAHSEGKTRNSL